MGTLANNIKINDDDYNDNGDDEDNDENENDNKNDNDFHTHLQWRELCDRRRSVQSIMLANLLFWWKPSDFTEIGQTSISVLDALHLKYHHMFSLTLSH